MGRVTLTESVQRTRLRKAFPAESLGPPGCWHPCRWQGRDHVTSLSVKRTDVALSTKSSDDSTAVAIVLSSEKLDTETTAWSGLMPRADRAERGTRHKPAAADQAVPRWHNPVGTELPAPPRSRSGAKMWSASAVYGDRRHGLLPTCLAFSCPFQLRSVALRCARLSGASTHTTGKDRAAAGCPVLFCVAPLRSSSVLCACALLSQPLSPQHLATAAVVAAARTQRRSPGSARWRETRRHAARGKSMTAGSCHWCSARNGGRWRGGSGKRST